MATSTITLYKVDFIPNMNAKIDDIETYLSNINNSDKIEFSNMQYQKTELIINIKVVLDQLYGSKVKYNYVKILNSDNSTHPFYYFITDSISAAPNVIKLQLSMDTVNSIWNDVSTLWNNKTLITRRHKDRFKQKTIIPSQDNTLYRDIDKRPEGLAVSKNNKSDNETVLMNYLIPEHTMNWYLIYKTIAVGDTNPVKCFLLPEETMTFRFTGTGSSIISASDITNHHTLTIRYKAGLNTGGITFHGDDGRSISLDSTTICAVRIMKNNNGKLDWTAYNNGYTISDTGEIDNDSFEVTGTMTECFEADNALTATDLKSKQVFDLIENNNKRFNLGPGGDITIHGIQYLDRADSTLIKIIECPYCPVPIQRIAQNPDVWQINVANFTYADGYLYCSDINQEFANSLADNKLVQNEMKETLTAVESDNLYVVNHNIKFESKLYHSDFYTKKYFYDSFEKEILLENLNATNLLSINLGCIYKQSNNISSRSLFWIGNNSSYKEITNYGSYLNTNRNNEMAIFNSDYINYMKTGYNYDKKKIQQQSTENWIKFGLSTIGSIVGVATGNVLSVSMATSALNSLVSNISYEQQAYAELDQKIKELQNSTASIVGADDLNLLNYYNGNKLQVCSYEPYDTVKDSIYNLFRLTGYSDNTYDIPTFNTRIWYDFLQCKPEFNKGFEYDNLLLDDFKSRLEVGITIFHHTNNTWDFTQTKENFESWMLN